jgi:hypothetical protein
MNAILGKSFSQLRKSEQDRILKQMEDAMDDELCKAQFIWIKYNCVAMANAGETADEILNYLGGWRHVYRINSRFKTKEEQDAFLDARMDEIFGAGGFPQEFMDGLREIGR